MKIKDYVKINELSVNKQYPFDEIEYLDTSSVTNGCIEKIQTIKLKEAPSRAKRIVRNDDILISTVRPNLRHFAIIKNPKPNTVASTGFAVITCQKVDSNYLYRFLTTDWYSEYLSNIAESQQSNYPAFNPSLIENTPVDFPPLGTQKKIAAILSAYDDLIENNKRRIALLENMAEEIYREWFVRFRFPGYQQVKFEKGIPVGWYYEKLDSLCKVIKRGISPKYNEESENLVINQKCIRNCQIDLSLARKHDTRTPKEKIIQYGDALINSTGVGTLGRISIVENKLNNVTVDSHVTICRANQRIINIHYLSFTISHLQTYFELMASGSTGQIELNRSLISGVKVLIPYSNLQNKFSDQIAIIWQQKQLIISSIDRLKTTKNMLISRLISGKLSVENLDIQFPPSML